MRQIDIFGKEVEVQDVQKTKVRKSIKQLFREKHGFLHGKFCKNCKYHKKFDYYYKDYYKCEKLGITSSKATDIRLKDTACKLYEEWKNE